MSKVILQSQSKLHTPHGTCELVGPQGLIHSIILDKKIKEREKNDLSFPNA